MNAATVSGPRSRITFSSKSAIFNTSAIGKMRSAVSRSLFSHRHEDLALALAPDENLREPPRGHLLQLAAGVGSRRHALPVDGENHVPLSERTGRRTIRVDVGDERPGLAGRHVELSRPLRRETAQGEAEALAPLLLWRCLAAAAVRAPALLGRQIEPVLLDGERSLLLVAHDF